jgi:hypothetical protein
MSHYKKTNSGLFFQCEDIDIWHSKFISHVQDINPASHLGVKKYQDLSITERDSERSLYESNSNIWPTPYKSLGCFQWLQIVPGEEEKNCLNKHRNDISASVIYRNELKMYYVQNCTCK